MVTVAPRVGVPAPIPVPSRHGLLSVATTPPDNNSRGWQGGITYQPEFSVPDFANAGVEINCPPSDYPGHDTVIEPGLVSWDPYELVHLDTTVCVLPDFLPEVRRRAERNLERFTGHYLENILWTGNVGLVDFDAAHPNVALSGPDTYTPVGTTAQGVVTGWGVMLRELGLHIGGVRGVIHVTPRTLSFLNFYGLVEMRGEQLFAKNTDHLVAVGTGYTGNGPSGVAVATEQWIVGTSPVQVRLGPIRVPFVRQGDGFNIENNRFEYRAMRLALASWDRTAHIGVPLCLPDPGPDCPAE